MTFEEFQALAKGMKAVYGAQNFLPDAESVKVYFSLLLDLDYSAASAAIQRHMLTNKFPPTIADIREQCAEIADTGKMDWLEGWNAIQRVRGRYGYNRPSEAIEALRDIDEKTARVAEMLGWQALCLSENPTADRANFRQCFERMQQRETETMKLPEAFSKAISAAASRLQIGGGKEC